MQVAPGTLRIFQPSFFLFVIEGKNVVEMTVVEWGAWLLVLSWLWAAGVGLRFRYAVCWCRPPTQAFPPQAPAPVSLPSAELPAVR